MKPHNTPAVRDTSRIVTIDRLSGLSTARVVSYERVIHPLYRKRYSKTSRMLVDTGGLTVHVGDSVRIVESRPISRHKSWKVVEVLKAAPTEASS